MTFHKPQTYPDNKVFSKSVLGFHWHLPFSCNQEGIFASRCNHLNQYDKIISIIRIYYPVFILPIQLLYNNADHNTLNVSVGSNGFFHSNSSPSLKTVSSCGISFGIESDLKLTTCWHPSSLITILVEGSDIIFW